MRNRTWILVFALFLMLSACGRKTTDNHEHKEGEKHEEQKTTKSSEDHSAGKKAVKLSPEAQKNAGIKTAPAKTEAVADTLEVTATISHNQDRLFHVTPRITRVWWTSE